MNGKVTLETRHKRLGDGGGGSRGVYCRHSSLFNVWSSTMSFCPPSPPVATSAHAIERLSHAQDSLRLRSTRHDAMRLISCAFDDESVDAVAVTRTPLICYSWVDQADIEALWLGCTAPPVIVAKTESPFHPVHVAESNNVTAAAITTHRQPHLLAGSARPCAGRYLPIRCHLQTMSLETHEC